MKHHPNYQYTAEADKKKNAFSLERLINRRMKTLNPNEQYTVYEADVPDGTDIDEDEDILNLSLIHIFLVSNGTELAEGSEIVVYGVRK